MKAGGAWIISLKRKKSLETITAVCFRSTSCAPTSRCRLMVKTSSWPNTLRSNGGIARLGQLCPQLRCNWSTTQWTRRCMVSCSHGTSGVAVWSVRIQRDGGTKYRIFVTMTSGWPTTGRMERMTTCGVSSHTAGLIPMNQSEPFWGPSKKDSGGPCRSRKGFLCCGHMPPCTAWSLGMRRAPWDPNTCQMRSSLGLSLLGQRASTDDGRQQ